MVLNNSHRKNFAIFYCCCFTISFCWLFFNGWLLHQLQPVFFLNRLDLSLNILFLTGIQHAIIKSFALQLSLDILYFILPLLLLFTVNRKKQVYLAIINSIFNLMYALILSSVSPLSIAGFVGWILLPLLFVFTSDRGFYYALNSMRYIFLLIFFSAGFWKIRAGGVFNAEQMSAILLKQHAAYLTQSPTDWFSSIVNYLVINYRFSYFIYLCSGIAELVFVVGFFTKKADKLLILIFLLFILFDFFLMRINYFAWVAFLGCLWFAKYKEPSYESRETLSA